MCNGRMRISVRDVTCVLETVGWDEIPASPCMIALGFHPGLRKGIRVESTQQHHLRITHALGANRPTLLQQLQEGLLIVGAKHTADVDVLQ